MRSNATDEELLRSYLLGELTEDETDVMERRLLLEDELFELSEALEADLLAACARNELAPAERERVQQRLASSPRGRERLALARSLSTLAGDAVAAPILPFVRRAPASAPRREVRWAALAAGLLAAAGLVWFALERPDHRGRVEIAARQQPSAPAVPAPTPPSPAPSPAPVEAPAPAPEPVKAVFQLALVSLRGSEAATRLRVPAGTGTIELQISVEGMEDLASFHLTLRNRKAEAVWEGGGLKPKKLEGIQVLVLDLPADRLPAGRYEIQAQGIAPGGEPEDLSPLEIEVVRGRKG